MFDQNPQKLPSITVAEMFRNSLNENSLQLATVPPFLILVAPRHERSQRSYRYIIPNGEITLDKSILQLACQDCGKTNGGSQPLIDFFVCDQCSSVQPSAPSTDTTIQCFCNPCLQQKHRQLHYSVFINHLPRTIKPDQHKMCLFAVLCIEISQYVAFVKCKTQQNGERWLFFDSMSDRIDDQRNVPSVSLVPDFDQWLSEPSRNPRFFTQLDATLQDQTKPMSQKFNENEMHRLRLFRDGAFFFYENATRDYE